MQRTDEHRFFFVIRRQMVTLTIQTIAQLVTVESTLMNFYLASFRVVDDVLTMCHTRTNNASNHSVDSMQK